MKPFLDYFSSLSDTYARYRPTYPPALYDFILSQCAGRDLAWDCGTGNGQVAFDLAPHFRNVYASDPSAEQIAYAKPAPNVTYHVERAETPQLKDESVDLITCGQAAHWFNTDEFNASAHRVLKKGGTICLWAYEDPLCVDERVTELINEIVHGTLGDYWPKGSARMFDVYRQMDFPFVPAFVPSIEMKLMWNLEELLGYIASWSATQQFVEKMRISPIDRILDRLIAVWGKPDEKKEMRGKMLVRLGHKMAV